MYSIHRICQAYQLAKFINLVAENSSNSRSGSDLILLAGDLNTSPGELPFKLILSMTGLADCSLHERGSLVNGCHDDDLITCGHQMNTYSEDATGKRIDFILYKLAQKCTCEVDCQCHVKHVCKGNRIKCLGKDPVTGLSFSDHQPVTLKIAIERTTTVKNKTRMSSNCHSASEMTNPSMEVSSLLIDYLKERHVFKKRFYLFLIGLAIMLTGLAIVSGVYSFMSTGVAFHTIFFVWSSAFFVILLIEFASRFERTAIKGILEEVLSLQVVKYIRQ